MEGDGRLLIHTASVNARTSLPTLGANVTTTSPPHLVKWQQHHTFHNGFDISYTSLSMDEKRILVSQPASGASSPQRRNFQASLTDWQITHLIQRLETVKDTGALPNWKSPYQVYLLAMRDLMTPSSLHSRRTSVCSYDDEEMVSQTPETASTAITEDSDSDIFDIQPQSRKRKRSSASQSSQGSFDDNPGWEKKHHFCGTIRHKNDSVYQELAQFETLDVKGIKFHQSSIKEEYFQDLGFIASQQSYQQ